ncbi:thioesterase family protein [Amycolatopsis sp. NPDC059657]|uniref:thioesterase family protein n=1 Tax=Amycolatopsis sp. NPDC059657 TaxID=3346899 RepID=UPI00366F7521
MVAPLSLYETRVPQDWVDYNGHMTEACYLVAAGESADAFYAYLGIGPAYRASGRSVYTAETHLRHLGEAVEGDELRLTLELLGYDAKRIHVFHTVSRRGDVIATVEQLLLHVDTAAARATPMSGELQGKLAAIHAAHAPLGVPEGAGRAITMSKGSACGST